MKNKTIIHEFDPCIYPRLLWVVKGGSLEGIQETFEVECEADDVGGAVTLPARRRSDGRLGYCVWFPKVGDIRRLDWIAHESSHVAVCIFNDIGGVITYEDQEPFAYLVGWVFGCIDTIRKFKEVKYGCDTSESEDRQEGEPQTPCEATQENRNG
jgi:hypothetical protein